MKPPFKNALTLMGGSALAQGTTLLMAPFLTRLFSPEEFGFAAVFWTIPAIVSGVICLSYEQSVLLPEKDEEALGILALCGWLAAFAAMATAGVLMLAPLKGEWKIAAVLLPQAILLAGLNQAVLAWSLRQRRFKWMAAARLSQAFGTVLGQLVLAFSFKESLSHGALILGSILGLASSVGVGAIAMGRSEALAFARALVDLRAIRHQAMLFKKFPLFCSGPSMLAPLTAALPLWFLGRFISAEAAGHFALAQRFIQAPNSLVGNAVSQVLYQESVGGQATPKGIQRWFFILLAVGAAIYGTVALWPAVFPIVFGEKWRMAGSYGSLIAPGAALSFAVAPLSVVLLAQGRQEWLALWKLVLLLGTTAGLALSLPYADAVASLTAVCVSTLLLYGGFAAFLLFQSQKESRKAVQS